MLLYKAWLETRFRLLFAVAIGLMYAFLFTSSKVPADGRIPGAGAIMTISAALMSVILAGAGIVTQSAMLATRGLHGSTLYTLSLPVTRVRILAVRAGLGWIEMAAGVIVISVAMWIGYAPLKAGVSLPQMAAFALTLIACISGFYSITVLLSTFLDDTWRVFGSFVSLALLWFLAGKVHPPDSINVFKAVTMGSPLFTHTVPWGPMAVSLMVSAILLSAAFKIAQAREY